MTYKEKLLDPRWQKKRLEIFNRDNFQCIRCGSGDVTLHVHHKTYIYGNDPWDYVNTNFSTLCDDCHSTEGEYKTWFEGIVHDLLLMGYDYESLYNFLENNYTNIKHTSFNK